MLRFGRGDAAAFEALYQRHETKVFRFLLRQVRNEALANDLMQEVWLAVVRSTERYQPTAKFTTWLFSIAHHKIIDDVRARRPMENLPSDGDVGDGGLSNQRFADPRPEPLMALEEQDQAAVLLRAVEALPSEQRAAFLLQAEGGLSIEEIALATGSSFEAVKSRLRYARAKLREWLGEPA